MIRSMTAEDIGVVWELEKACFSDPWSSAILEESIYNELDFCLVLEESGVICGYGCLRLIAGEGEIERIAVLPAYRGRGLGKKLMEAMVAFARNQDVHSVTLEVRSGNEPARNLYKSYGFREEGVRRSYYKNPSEDAVIMWNRCI